MTKRYLLKFLSIKLTKLNQIHFKNFFIILFKITKSNSKLHNVISNTHPSSITHQNSSFLLSYFQLSYTPSHIHTSGYSKTSLTPTPQTFKQLVNTLRYSYTSLTLLLTYILLLLTIPRNQLIDKPYNSFLSLGINRIPFSSLRFFFHC
jgi:hypothetical protein